MKVSSIAVLAALAVPAASEIYLKEQFNDKVRVSKRFERMPRWATFPMGRCNANGKVFSGKQRPFSHPPFVDFCTISISTGLEQAMDELNKVEAQG